MPRYSGPIIFLFEVLAHLLLCYLVLTVLAACVISLLVSIGSIFSSDPLPNLLFWWIVDGRMALFLSVHIAIFSNWRLLVWPRFSYAPALATFAFSALLGSSVLAVVLALDRPKAGNYWVFLLLLVGAAMLGGLLDRFNYYWGGGAGAPPAIGRWVGRFLVGREAFDTFVEQEAARLNKNAKIIDNK